MIGSLGGGAAPAPPAPKSARAANEPGDAGELPTTPPLALLLLQAGMKHTTARDPSTAAQRFMAHAITK
jgi:hypothetical protein